MYIGLRSCVGPAEDDPYMGSSHDKKFKKLLSDKPKIFTKIIIGLWPSRNLAAAHEIWLHGYYNVATNPLYYNKCNAIGSGFSMLGVKTSPETKLKQSLSSIGQERSAEYRKNISKAKIGSRNPLFKGWCIHNGTKYTPVELSKHLGHKITRGCCDKWCKNNNSVISIYTYINSHYLQSLGPSESLIGKTFEQLGFSFEFV